MTSVTIIHQIDVRHDRPGGVDGVIRDMIRFAPTTVGIRVIGVDATGDLRLGRWYGVECEGRPIKFLPIARLDPGAVRRGMPHTARLLAGLARYRTKFTNGIVHAHRAEVGIAVTHLLATRRLVQFIHGDTVAGVGSTSDSLWRRAPMAFARLERWVAQRSSVVVVFNRYGAERLSAIHPWVLRAQAWFRPDVFRPQSVVAEPRSLLWVGRFETPKDPLLAVDVLAAARRQDWPDATLTMLGGGRLLREIQERVAEHGVENAVDVRGPANGREVATAMNAHAVVVVTSHFEGPTPRVAVESLACGTPVLATAAADPDELIRDRVNGVRAIGRDPEFVARGLSVAASCSGKDCVSSVAHLRADMVIPRLFDQTSKASAAGPR